MFLPFSLLAGDSVWKWHRRKGGRGVSAVGPILEVWVPEGGQWVHQPGLEVVTQL